MSESSVLLIKKSKATIFFPSRMAQRFEKVLPSKNYLYPTINGMIHNENYTSIRRRLWIITLNWSFSNYLVLNEYCLSESSVLLIMNSKATIFFSFENAAKI